MQLIGSTEQEVTGKGAEGEDTYDSQLGQTLFYLLAIQLQTLGSQTSPPPPPPVMGLFMADGNVRLHLTMNATSMQSVQGGALSSVLGQIQAILSMKSEVT